MSSRAADSPAIPAPTTTTSTWAACSDVMGSMLAQVTVASNPAPCATDGDCPPDFTCFLAAPEAVCERRACNTDAVCDGWCIGGACRAQPGTCGFPPG